MGMAATATIIIRRDSEKDIKMRGLEIFLDGEFVVDLPFSKSHSVEVEVGEHTIKASNRLYNRTLDLDLSPGQTAILQVGNVMGGAGGLMMAAVGIGPYKVFLDRIS